MSTPCCLPPLQPLHLHGSLGRDSATGKGVLFATREFLKNVLYTKVEGSTFIIQVGVWSLNAHVPDMRVV